MPHDTSDELRRLQAAEQRLHMENEQLRAEVEHVLESRRTSDDALTRYSELYDHAPLPLVTLDNLGTIHALNLTAAGILGSEKKHRASLIGQRLRRYVVEGDQGILIEHLRRCQSATDAVSCELRLKLSGEDVRVVSLWSRRPRPDVRSYPSAIVDLTESKKNAAEIERLVEAERSARVASEAKDQFIAVLSHELRTPLTPVLAAASALAARDDIDPHLRSVCEMIRRNVVTEARLIDDLLDVSRMVRGKMLLRRELVNVHDLATEAVGMVREEANNRGIAIVEGLEARRHWAFADSIRMRQVLWNLLRNAVKFTPNQGRIEVRTWNRDGRLAVEVSDNGVGFEQETAPRLFEAFEQDRTLSQRFGGLGLGLAICKGLMDLHDGAITGTSPGRDQGARFVIELDSIAEPRPAAPPVGVLIPAEPAKPVVPVVPDIAPVAKGRAVPPSLAEGRSRPVAPVLVLNRGKKLREEGANPRVCILLVEDDPDTGDMLRELLTDAGYEVRIARSARAALAEKLERIDLVLSDIGLPDGSGLDLMRALRGRRAIKGIALSGYGTEADVRASREAGFQAHLTKPIEVNGLLEAIDEVAGTA